MVSNHVVLVVVLWLQEGNNQHMQVRMEMHVITRMYSLFGLQQTCMKTHDIMLALVMFHWLVAAEHS